MLNELIHLAALVCLVALAGYILLLILNEVRRFKQSLGIAELERELLRVRLGLAKNQQEFEQKRAELSWNGFRKFTIISKRMECTDICSFYLAPHDQKPLPPYYPGQYLTFQLRIPGQQRPVVRCYSLSDSPHHPDYYRVTIRRVKAPSGQENIPHGLVSGYFHDQLQEGDILDVKAPSGHFFLETSQQTPIVLIAGGVGLTPILSMMNTLAETGSGRETWIFYGARNGSDVIQKDSLERLALEHTNFRLHICLSQPASSDQLGGNCYEGRVTVDFMKQFLPSNNYTFFICGPGPMMSSITQDLKTWGVEEKNICLEAFGASTIKSKAPVATSTTASGFQITFGRSNKICAWTPETGSLLDFACENDVKIDSGCRAGNCGTCLTAIKSGEVHYLNEPGFKPEAGSCLTCIAIPKSNLVLDA